MGGKPWAKALRLISRNALAYGLARLRIDAQISFEPKRLPPKKAAGTLRRAVRSRAFAMIPGGRHMECAYYFVDGTWNVPTTLTFVGCVKAATIVYWMSNEPMALAFQ